MASLKLSAGSFIAAKRPYAPSVIVIVFVDISARMCTCYKYFSVETIKYLLVNMTNSLLVNMFINKHIVILVNGDTFIYAFC